MSNYYMQNHQKLECKLTKCSSHNFQRETKPTVLIINHKKIC